MSPVCRRKSQSEESGRDIGSTEEPNRMLSLDVYNEESVATVKQSVAKNVTDPRMGFWKTASTQSVAHRNMYGKSGKKERGGPDVYQKKPYAIGRSV